MSQAAAMLRRIQLAVACIALAVGVGATTLNGVHAGSAHVMTAHGNKHPGKGNKHKFVTCGVFAWDGTSVCI